jgi:hypothetical protein
VQPFTPLVGFVAESHLAIAHFDAHIGEQRPQKPSRRRVVAQAHTLLLVVDFTVDDETVARLHALRDITNLGERIESAHGVARKNQQARRFRGIRGVDEMHGARYIGLDAGTFEIVVFGAGARGLDHGLARIDRKIDALAAGVLERVHQQTIARSIACAKTDDGNAPAEMARQSGRFTAQFGPGFDEAAIEGRLFREPRPFRGRSRKPIEELFRKVAGFHGLDEFLRYIGFG